MDMLQRFVESGCAVCVWHNDYYVIGTLRSATPCVMDVIFGHEDPRFAVDLERSYPVPVSTKTLQIIGEDCEISDTFQTCRLFRYDDGSVRFFIEHLEHFFLAELDELVEYVISSDLAKSDQDPGGTPTSDLLGCLRKKYDVLPPKHRACIHGLAAPYYNGGVVFRRDRRDLFHKHGFDFGGVAKSLVPAAVPFITMEPDVLVIVGLGMVFGRDAVEKLITAR